LVAGVWWLVAGRGVSKTRSNYRSGAPWLQGDSVGMLILSLNPSPPQMLKETPTCAPASNAFDNVA